MAFLDGLRDNSKMTVEELARLLGTRPVAPADAVAQSRPREATIRPAPVDDWLEMLKGMVNPVQWGEDAAGTTNAAVRALSKGNVGDFATNAAMTAMAVPVIPGAGGILGKALAKVTGKAAASNLGKGAIRSMRGATAEEALQAFRNGEHLNQVSTTGQYVGAPRGVDSPQKLGALRQRFDKKVEAGAPGGDWYHRAVAGNIEAAGPDPVKQHLLAQEEGLFSSQANPDVNLGFLLNAHNGWEAGAPESLVHTGAQATEYNAARTAGRDIHLGPKTGQFANKLDPTQVNTHVPTNDIWHFRALEYVDPTTGKPWSSGGTPQMHAFTDAETMLAADRANAKVLGGHNDWDAGSVQAAPWVLGKAQDLFKKHPKLYPTFEDALREAAKTYPDHFPKYTANATHEAIPGRNTGHLPGLVDAPAAERAAYSTDPRSSWADPETGRDAIYDALNMHQTREVPATGYFRPEGAAPLETNPAAVARPLVGLQQTSAGKVVHPTSAKQMDAAESLRAYFDAQEAGAWHKLMPEGRAAEATSVNVPMNRAVTPEEMRAVADTFEPRGFGLSDTGQGLSLLNVNGGPADGGLIRKLMTKGRAGGDPRYYPKGAVVPAAERPWLEDLREALPEATGAADRARMSSGYLKTRVQAATEGEGKATRRLLARMEDPATPKIFAQLDTDPAVRERVLAKFDRDASLGDKHGRARPDMQDARRIFAGRHPDYPEGGLTGLARALAAGVALPALALTTLNESLPADPEDGP